MLWACNGLPTANRYRHPDWDSISVHSYLFWCCEKPHTLNSKYQNTLYFPSNVFFLVSCLIWIAQSPIQSFSWWWTKSVCNLPQLRWNANHVYTSKVLYYVGRLNNAVRKDLGSSNLFSRQNPHVGTHDMISYLYHIKTELKWYTTFWPRFQFRQWLGTEKATGHYMINLWPNSLTYKCVTRPLWVELMSEIWIKYHHNLGPVVLEYVMPTVWLRHEEGIIFT